MAVLGIALIAMGEEIGAEMALRTFGHLVSLAEESGMSFSEGCGGAGHGTPELCMPDKLNH